MFLQVGAPLRPVTVRDAIGDLPAIENGHSVEEMEYVSGPVSCCCCCCCVLRLPPPMWLLLPLSAPLLLRNASLPGRCTPTRC